VSDIQFVDGSTQRIAYRRSGEGPPVVLLHPLALSGAIWGPFAETLSERFDVVAPDARGCGESGWDRKPFGITDLADDVAALLDGLDLTAAAFVGLSMGGSTALAFAGRHPERVTRLTLADTTAWYGPDAPQTWEQRAEGVLAKPRVRQVPFQVERWFTDSFRQRRPDVVNRIVEVFLRTDSAAHAEACRALGHMDSRELLPEIAAPTLVMTGVEDYATPPDMGSAIAAGVQHGTMRTLDGLRHLSLIEAPALAADVAAHLDTAEVVA
jgi:3-oxoadipate enol-lactonase